LAYSNSGAVSAVLYLNKNYGISAALKIVGIVALTLLRAFFVACEITKYSIYWKKIPNAGRKMR
jgi:hypothetical protein